MNAKISYGRKAPGQEQYSMVTAEIEIVDEAPSDGLKLAAWATRNRDASAA